MQTDATIARPFGPLTHRLGVISAVAVALLQAVYVVVLAVGLATLPAPDVPIADPWFTAMELLILLMMLPMVLMMAVLTAWAAPDRKALGHAALAFMTVMAGLTSVVHGLVLTLSRLPPFAGMEHVFAFRWPSVVYVIDILAWDVFFALSVLCAAFVFDAHPWTRRMLILCGGLALAGLIGVPLADMSLRNIGILGYAVLFPVAALLMARAFALTLTDTSG